MINFLKRLIELNKSIFKIIVFPHQMYLLGLLLMPLDSFPYFPTSNVYRPVSFFPIFIYWVFIFLKKLKLKFADARLLLIIIIAIIYTFFLSLYIHHDFSGFYKFALNAFICFVFVNSTREFIQSLHLNRKETLNYFSKVFIIASILPMTLGWIQLFGRFGIIPSDFATILTSIFSYRVDVSRIQWVSGEPAMGFRFISMSVFFIIIFYKENKKIKNLFVLSSTTLLLLSGSSFGYIFIIAILVFHFFINPVFNKRLILKIIPVLIIAIFVFQVIFNFLPEYTKERLLNITALFHNLNTENILLLAKADGSFFLRVFNPLIGFIMSFKNYGFGVGGECFHFQYIDIINTYFPFAINHSAVQEVLYKESIITPKSFYSKLISEFGIIGLALFLSMLYRLYRKIKVSGENEVLWIFSFVCMMILNSDSYIYYNFLFLLTLLHQIYQPIFPKRK